MSDAEPIPPRAGHRPRTTPTNPHKQLDQQPAHDVIRDRLAERLFHLPDVEERPSQVSVPGARALRLRDGVAPRTADAFMVEREFAHLHPGRDYSLHACLPPDLAAAAIEAGWAELHPVARLGLIPATTVMLYAPRDDRELEVIYRLVVASYRYAGGRIESADA
ncbi:MAG: hypothetical protein NVS4B2_07260 [Chloroflexota bacterium]